ncbi:unnamed protein product [Arabis nemorensis]|uniref:Uncharacterized protein n=1 Tax=Arabis nemorensis TaxID=586526 RepID=A0A565CF83_9BRAS|nr:unnamed protein product [Arabis nemorensis]
MEDDSFHCEYCNGELVVESNKLTSEEVVDRGDNAKRTQRGKKKDLLQNFEVQTKPLMNQINRVKDLPVPKLESFPEWEARAAKAAREIRDLNPNQCWLRLTLVTEQNMSIEVNLGDGTEHVKHEGGDSSRKVMPQWMITEGMNLTDEQRGLIRHEAKDEYLRAYAAAVRLKQQELAERLNQQEPEGELTPQDIQSASTSSSDR